MSAPAQVPAASAGGDAAARPPVDAPRATARLQFHAGFTLDAAAELVPYFRQLGISHLYASPLTRAQPGSIHGYDTIDYTQVSPELGGEAALRRLVERLRAAGMGLILDIVPNHMATSHENPWWWSVLELGRASPHAGYFDIDWDVPDPALRGKLLAPFLGDPYGVVLEAGQLSLQRDEQSGEFYVAYYDSRFPVSPESVPLIERHRAELPQAYDAGRPDGRRRLHELLERQHYRLAWWRSAAEEINWRRFFEISDLAGLRAERAEVREATHALTFRLYRQGLIDGVRVDHVDGLADPAGYCHWLRQRLDDLAPHRPPGVPGGRAYIVVEKILAADEGLSRQWDVDGTTGYDFMSEAGALLHDAAGEVPLTACWQRISGDTRAFYRIVHDVRRRLIAQNFAGEFGALCSVLHRIARAQLATRDWGLPAIRRVVTELLVFFPVYRTYATEAGRAYVDQAVFASAAGGARGNLQPADHALLDLIDGWLGGEPPREAGTEDERAWRLEAIRRFQQLTAPLSAKSVEDTAFYRYGRLLSRNEVGADPASFAIGVEDFHRKVLARAVFPDAMLVTATHDHKRGEDARARLAVLSELPGQWLALAERWSERHERFKQSVRGVPAPAAPDEYMLYQTLLGAWPADLDPGNDAGLRELAERVAAWQTKSLREAKLRSSWVAPADAYEEACNAFLQALLAPSNRDTLGELHAFVQRIGVIGAINSLAQLLLRCTLPGVPDLYQGTEFWDFSLVDPDNRRPVDFAARQAALSAGGEPAQLLRQWRDGRVKQYALQRLLAVRQQHAGLFRHGHYLPLAVQGDAPHRAIAYARTHEGRAVVAVAPHCCASLALSGDAAPDLPLVPPARWGDAAVAVADHLPDGPLVNVFTGAGCSVSGGLLPLREVLADFPIAVLVT
ncbi:malto-oligosyltrehalose synthase [Pigmentiphaga soli]|uniref:Malto-oligosyltrehalose synthase n=1 Tax=Pigmentiphaga soli TaxID=1007095 RepID=A0ABP8H643_9BURK